MGLIEEKLGNKKRLVCYDWPFFMVLSWGLFFGSGLTRNQFHFDKLAQHLVWKFYPAFSLIKSEVAGDSLFEKIDWGDFMLAIFQHKTYKSNSSVLKRIEG